MKIRYGGDKEKFKKIKRVPVKVYIEDKYIDTFLLANIRELFQCVYSNYLSLFFNISNDNDGDNDNSDNLIKKLKKKVEFDIDNFNNNNNNNFNNNKNNNTNNDDDNNNNNNNNDDDNKNEVELDNQEFNMLKEIIYYKKIDGKISLMDDENLSKYLNQSSKYSMRSPSIFLYIEENSEKFQYFINKILFNNNNKNKLNENFLNLHFIGDYLYKDRFNHSLIFQYNNLSKIDQENVYQSLIRISHSPSIQFKFHKEMHHFFDILDINNYNNNINNNNNNNNNNNHNNLNLDNKNINIINNNNNNNNNNTKYFNLSIKKSFHLNNSKSKLAIAYLVFYIPKSKNYLLIIRLCDYKYSNQQKCIPNTYIEFPFIDIIKIALFGLPSPKKTHPNFTIFLYENKISLLSTSEKIEDHFNYLKIKRKEKKKEKEKW